MKTKLLASSNPFLNAQLVAHKRIIHSSANLASVKKGKAIKASVKNFSHKLSS